MTSRRVAVLGLFICVSLAHPARLAGGQQTAAPAQPVLTPSLTPEQMEDFLLYGRIVRTREINKGVTNSRRATIMQGSITHEAHIQTVDISMQEFRGARGGSELNFKDTYRYNIAAYRLARLLGLDNVPMSVERAIGRDRASVTWWVDDVLMDEGERRRKHLAGPNPSRTAAQIHIMRVFDELIANVDRNAGNLLWTADWQMWMIDHTRAFRLGKSLRQPQFLERCERGLLESLRGLTVDRLRPAIGDSLSRFEMEALLARRDAIVKLFDAKIAERGEAAILYTFAR